MLLLLAFTFRYTTNFVEFVGRFKLLINWAAGPAYHGLVIDYFQGDLPPYLPPCTFPHGN